MTSVQQALFGGSKTKPDISIASMLKRLNATRFAALGSIAVALVGLSGCGGNAPEADKPKPAPASTEQMLRRTYDERGIKYDDSMIRKDAKAIDKLNQEFGK